MRLTTYTDYAMRVLIFVAAKGEGKATIQEIAHSYGISKNHLMKVVQELHQKGYLRATRGKYGGLSLGRRPEEINLGHLVREVEKDFTIAECFAADNGCVITPACCLQALLARALAAFLAVLDDYTLADILAEASPGEISELLAIG
jgi:Rrf2 family transcriptional regulator, nitric oxide-sensitive transcriptional repressor